MTPAAVVIIIRRPRLNAPGYDESQVTVSWTGSETDHQLLQAATTQTEGPALPPQS